MARPMETPGQGVFGDSLTVLSRTQEDASKLVVTAANVVPGAPACLTGGNAATAANRGKLHSIVSSSQDIFYGAFVNPPANSVYGRSTMGEFDAKRADVLLQGNILVRDCVYMDVTTALETTISLWNAKPVAGDVGKPVWVFEVVNGFAVGTNMLKWSITKAAPNNSEGFGETISPVAKLVGISDDATEFELSIVGHLAPRTL